jgi:multicomponent Na+:H+ antiporter subunit A
MDAPSPLACGLGFMLLLMKSTQLPFNLALTEFFAAYAKIIAHGATS